MMAAGAFFRGPPFDRARRDPGVFPAPRPLCASASANAGAAPAGAAPAGRSAAERVTCWPEKRVMSLCARPSARGYSSERPRNDACGTRTAPPPGVAACVRVLVLGVGLGSGPRLLLPPVWAPCTECGRVWLGVWPAAMATMNTTHTAPMTVNQNPRRAPSRRAWEGAMGNDMGGRWCGWGGTRRSQRLNVRGYLGKIGFLHAQSFNLKQRQALWIPEQTRFELVRAGTVMAKDGDPIPEKR